VGGSRLGHARARPGQEIKTPMGTCGGAIENETNPAREGWSAPIPKILKFQSRCWRECGDDVICLQIRTPIGGESEQLLCWLANSFKAIKSICERNDADIDSTGYSIDASR
jgi:hypothetical protein